VVPASDSLEGGKSLHHFDGFRFAVFAKHGGRAPELENRDTLEWMGRFLDVSTPSAHSNHFNIVPP